MERSFLPFLGLCRAGDGLGLFRRAWPLALCGVLFLAGCSVPAFPRRGAVGARGPGLKFCHCSLGNLGKPLALSEGQAHGRHPEGSSGTWNCGSRFWALGLTLGLCLRRQLVPDWYVPDLGPQAQPILVQAKPEDSYLSPIRGRWTQESSLYPSSGHLPDL